MKKNQRLTLFLGVLIIVVVAGAVVGTQFLRRGTTAVTSWGVDVTITAPKTGDILQYGVPYTVKWTSAYTGSDPAFLTIYKYTMDGRGVEWATIATVPAAQGSYNWIVDLYSLDWRILASGVYTGPFKYLFAFKRVSGEFHNFNVINNMGYFTVTPSVDLIFPNGGETWQAGKTYDIIWQAAGASRVSIELVKGFEKLQVKTGVLASTGKFSYTVPATIADTDTGYKIHIWDADAGSAAIGDYSNNTFGILGMKWCGGADINKDGKVSIADMSILSKSWQKTCQSPDWCNGTDINRSGKVDLADQTIIGQRWGNTCSGS